jgi:hypothetical protein
MSITKENKKWIDNASYESLLRKWRFEESGNPLFEGETGEYYAHMMRRREAALQPGASAQISKKIGWTKPQ